MRLSNLEMDQMLSSLIPFLEHKDIIGYASARNTRILKNELLEYYNYRDELIKKYGDLEKDSDGNETGRSFISDKSEKFKEYVKDISEFAVITHEVNIFTIPFDKACGILTGNQILELEWMFEDSDTPQDC